MELSMGTFPIPEPSMEEVERVFAGSIIEDHFTCAKNAKRMPCTYIFNNIHI